MAQTPEGKVKDAVKKELRKRDIWYFMPMQNGFGVVGIPDFICCWEGTFLAIETKAPRQERRHHGKPRPCHLGDQRPLG